MFQKHKFLLIIFLFLSLYSSLQAQEKEKVLLVDVLNQLEEEAGIRFTFNYSLFQYLKVDKPDFSLELENIFSAISQEYSFIQFDLTNEDNVKVISSFPSNLQIRLVLDNESKASVREYTAYIKNGGIQTTTSEDSAMLINVLPIDTIHISAEGYQTLKITASQLYANKGLISLKPRYIHLETVELSSYFSSGINTNLNNHSIEVSMEKLGLLAGETEGDIFQLFKSLPGIRSPNGKPGSFNLRGNVFNQNLIYFDYIPVYHNGHYFGTFSPYNPKVVDQIDIFRNSLPSQWGGRVGGLLILESSDQIEDQLETNAFVNTVFGGASVKSPLVRDKLSLTLAFRGNLGFNSPKLDEYSELNFQGSRIDLRRLDDRHILDRAEIHFNDFNARMLYQINSRHQVSFSFLNISNSSDHLFLTLDQDESDSNLSQLSNWGSSVHWKGKFSAKTWMESHASISQLNITETRTEDIISTREQNRFDAIKNQIRDYRFSLIAKHDFNVSNKMSLGYELKNQNLNFYSTLIEFGTLEKDTERHDSAYTNALFANYQALIGLKWIVNLGLRAENYSLTEQSFIEPRISVSYLWSSKLSLKSSLGRSHQYLQQRIGSDFNDFKTSNQFWILSNDQNPVLESDKLMIGAVYKTNSWLIDLELFGQITSNISRKPGPVPTEFGDQSNLGLDILIRKNWGLWQSWISYTLAQTHLDFGESNRAFFDQTHVLSMNAALKLKRFKATASWGLMSGLPLDPSNNLGHPYTSNFPNQHQLDLSATFSFLSPSSKWKGILGVSLINVYNQELIINQFVNATDINNSLRFGLGFAPGIQLSITR